MLRTRDCCVFIHYLYTDIYGILSKPQRTLQKREKKGYKNQRMGKKGVKYDL